MLDYLSGNVPGGIYIYLLVTITLFLVLYSVSRRNDLFTPRRFKWWFAGIWIVLTAVYIAFWLRNPPAEVLSRYAIAIRIENSEHRWAAEWVREEMEALLPPYTSRNNYLYVGSQLPGKGILNSAEAESEWRRQMAALNVRNPIVATLSGKARQWQVSMQSAGTSATSLPPANLTLNLANAGGFRKEFRTWAAQRFDLPDQTFDSGNLPDSLFMAAQGYFVAKEYQKSLKLCDKTRQDWQNHPQIIRLTNFNRIRLAAQERISEGPRNPFEYKPRPWQQQLQQARAELIDLIKENIADNVLDPQLNSMMAESFIQEELFADAEEFLKLAYAANPFQVDVLENLSLLHPTRYHSLGFASENQLLQRILDLYPAHIPTLTRFVEREILSVPVKDAATANTRRRINAALRLKPRSPEILMLKGKFLLAVFQYQDALRSFSQADSLRPGNATTQYNLGICAFKMENLPLAENYFKNAIKLSDYLNAHLYLGVVYQQQEQYEKALAAFRHRVANKTGDDDYYALQAMKGIRECLEALNIPIPQQ